jgi:hypothetical protein
MLFGCATHKAYNYADYKSSLLSDMTFYTQYEIAYKLKDHVIVSPFLADSNEYLPNDIVKLHLGLLVKNPRLQHFDIWVDSVFTGLDSNDELQTSTLVYQSQGLPEEFISIDLPTHKVNTQVEFTAVVVSEDRILYESFKARYKIREVKLN